jgi:hypothetical protein
MKDSDRILFTKEEFDYILDALPKSPMELAVIAHTMLTQNKLSEKDEQIYSIILRTSKHLIKSVPYAMKLAFPELFQ